MVTDANIENPWRQNKMKQIFIFFTKLPRGDVPTRASGADDNSAAGGISTDAPAPAPQPSSPVAADPPPDQGEELDGPARVAAADAKLDAVLAASGGARQAVAKDGACQFAAVAAQVSGWTTATTSEAEPPEPLGSAVAEPCAGRPHITLPVFTIPKQNGKKRLLVDGREFDRVGPPPPPHTSVVLCCCGVQVCVVGKQEVLVAEGDGKARGIDTCVRLDPPCSRRLESPTCSVTFMPVSGFLSYVCLQET